MKPRVEITIYRGDYELTVEVELSVYIGRNGADGGYWDGGAYYNDDPSEVTASQWGTVTESVDPEHEFGSVIELTEPERRRAEQSYEFPI